MTAGEWAEIVTEVKSLWGNNAKWSQAEKAYKYAQSIPPGATRSAIQSMFLEGKPNAPSPSEVLAAAQNLVKHAATSDELAKYCQLNGHLWAIVDEDGEVRTVICGRCKTETTMLGSLVPTKGEIDARESALTDQIAP